MTDDRQLLLARLPGLSSPRTRLHDAVAKSLVGALALALAATWLAAARPAHAATITFDDVGLEHGSLVGDQYAESLGVLISADNFHRSFDHAVAFDSNEDFTRDFDLERHGSWSAGNIPELYPEDQDFGLMLIIQENDYGCLSDGVCDKPDDEGMRGSGGAGTLTIEFTGMPVLDFGFDIVDVEGLAAEDGRVTFYDFDAATMVTVGFMSLLQEPDLGDNSANRILPVVVGQLEGIGQIDKVMITLGGSGAIDNLTFTPVPEPSSLVLAGLGLAGLGIAGRARRRRSTA